MSHIGGSAAAKLRSYIERAERLNEEIKALNADKSALFKEARAEGFDPKAVKAVIARRAKDEAEISEFDQLVALYESAIAGIGTEDATRARAQAIADQAVSPTPFDDETGEIHDTHIDRQGTPTVAAARSSTSPDAPSGVHTLPAAGSAPAMLGVNSDDAAPIQSGLESVARTTGRLPDAGTQGEAGPALIPGIPGFLRRSA